MGRSHAAIPHAVHISQRTILRWLAAGSFPERKLRTASASAFALYADYLTQRWAEGCHIRPNISHRLPLADVAKAMRLLIDRKAIGRVALMMG